MAVWIFRLEKFTTVAFRAFIDDSYLWTSILHLNDLKAAVDRTIHWDSLSGQFLNQDKCEIFATRKPKPGEICKLHFPR